MRFKAAAPDVPALLRGLKDAEKQTRFALSLALNTTAKDAQKAIQKEMETSFSLRRKSWDQRNVKFAREDYATKQKLESTIRLVRPGQPGGNSIFSKFEEGGSRVATDPEQPIAIPSENIRPNFSDLPPRSLLPKNLRLITRKGVTGELAPRVKTTKRGVKQWLGKRRTFVLDPKEHFGVKTWGVYQRTGRGRGEVRLIWTYKTKIPIPKKLGFEEISRRVYQERMPVNTVAAIERALRTARLK